uniref:RxLR effector protein n=1 Tax=Phytophthora ramorum TaxID=164328 RepID=H3H5P3_PHYRM
MSAHTAATASVNGFQLEESNKRFLRSYGMSDLDVKEDSSEEERGIDLTKLDDVINVVKGDKVIDAAKVDDVLNAAKLDDVVKVDKVVNAAKVDDVIDEGKLDDLLQPDKIALALKDPNEEMALFAQWHESEELSKAILKRLHANGGFFKNQAIIFRYNDYRTRFAFNKQLTPWLDTKTLDETLSSLQNHGMKKMTEQFEVWFKDGRTKQQIADALQPHPKLAKKFKVLESHYGHFVDYKAIKIKRAAAAEAKTAAEAKKAAEVVEAS